MFKKLIALFRFKKNRFQLEKYGDLSEFTFDELSIVLKNDFSLRIDRFTDNSRRFSAKWENEDTFLEILYEDDGSFIKLIKQNGKN